MAKTKYKGYIVDSNGTIYNKNQVEMRGGKTAKYHKFACFEDGVRTDMLKHRFIWEAFNGPITDGLHIDHINNDPSDNRLENLQLLTPQENAIKRGGAFNAKKRKLTTEQIKEIRSLYPEFTIQRLGALYDVHHTTIHSVITAKTYQDIL